MKTTRDFLKQPIIVRLVLLPALLAAAPPQALAAVTDVANAPFTATGASPAKPNVMFILDDSGSMKWSHMPDSVVDKFFVDGSGNKKYGYVSAQCNGVFYDPAVNYLPPKNADGTSFPNVSFTAAPYNGFIPSAKDPKTNLSVINLSTGFKAWDEDTSGKNNNNDTPQPAYYYAYSGSATVRDYANTSSTFYKECASNIGSTPGKTKFTKVDVVSGTAAEKQNFANWFSYYRTRMLTMKTGAGAAFVGLNDSLRVGLTTISYTGVDNLDPKFLNISDFNAGQKASWFTKIYNTSPSGRTPLRGALSKVGRIYAGKASSITAGGADPLQYWCQRNYAILSTDGYWNSDDETASYGPLQINGSSKVDNQDSATKEAKPQYEGPTAYLNTLADVAAYYYNTDLRNGPACLTGAGTPASDVCKNLLEARGNDKASHQHMTTYAIGLGVSGQLNYQENYETANSGDYYEIKQGTKFWPKPLEDSPTAVDDLWHAAVNGRGIYFSARNPTSLTNGLGKALSDLQAKEGAGAAAATSNLEPVIDDNFAFTADYRTVSWDGDIQGRTIDLDNGALSEVPLWSAKPLLAARVSPLSDSRKIYMFDSATASKLKDFDPSGFTAAQKAAWFNPTLLPQYATFTGAQQGNATSDRLINYLRGQTGFEMQSDVAAPNQLFRDREFVLGDIVTAKPVHVRVPPFQYADAGFETYKSSPQIKTRKGAVYVGANDGMLHAFDAATGEELWAYVPSAVLPNMSKLANRDYATNHRYFVDGSPTAAEFYDGSSWKTILVGGMGAGGRAYYALDITNPDSPKALWEFTDVNLGLTIGSPIVGKLADGTWAVMFGSGHNNVAPGDGVGRLYILNAGTGALIRTISTGVGSVVTPSGLSKVAGWADKGLTDNTIQRVYGGDLLGNMWRFDINNTIAATPGYDAFKLGEFKIGGIPQPITARPDLALVNGSINVVYFGTGKLLGITDLTDTSQQSIYAVKDVLTAPSMGDARLNAACPLVKQDIIIQSPTARSISANPVDWSTKCGWYIDLNPSGQSPGERVNLDVKLQVGVLAVATNVPQNDVCVAGGVSWLYLLSYANGSFVVSELSKTAGQLLGNSLAVGISTFGLPNGKVVTNARLADRDPKSVGNPSNGSGSGGGKRVSWRELYSR